MGAQTFCFGSEVWDPQTSLLEGCMGTPQRMERCKPKQGLPRSLGQRAGLGTGSACTPKIRGLVGTRIPRFGLLLLRWQELRKSCRVESFGRRLPGPAASPGALAATLHCTYYCLSLQRVPSQ